jgi:hypothetical protein
MEYEALSIISVQLLSPLWPCQSNVEMTNFRTITLTPITIIIIMGIMLCRWKCMCGTIAFYTELCALIDCLLTFDFF